MKQLHDTTESIKDEWAQIEILKQENYSNRDIAARLGRAPQTINNEIKRGTSENQHKLIRRFIPKGQPISAVSDRQILRIQRWMNDYPRKILGYRTPHESFAKAMQQTQPAHSA